RDGRPAIQLVLERVPATLAITIPAFLLKIAIGVPAGIYAALHRNSFADRLTMLLSVAGFTMPSFVLALLLVLVFSVKLGWLPSSGSEGMANAILPIVTLGAAGAAILARFTRSAMLEVLGQPYIRAASAKGLSWLRSPGSRSCWWWRLVQIGWRPIPFRHSISRRGCCRRSGSAASGAMDWAPTSLAATCFRA